MNCHWSSVSLNLNCTFVDVPRSTSIPAFCDGVPASLLLSTIMLSSTVNVSVLTTVCVPFTVKFPLNTASLLNVLAPAIVCAPVVLTTVESTSMSFAFAVIPSPPTTLSDTVPATPPPVRPSPAVTPVIVPPIAVTSWKLIAPEPSVANTWFALPSDVGNVYASDIVKFPVISTLPFSDTLKM